MSSTHYRDDFTQVTDTKAIRKAVLAPDESVIANHTDGDNEAVTPTVLTDRHRVAIIRFTGDTARHVNVPVTHIRFLGGAVDGITTRATETAGMHAAAFRFVVETLEEPLDVTFPVSPINSVAGREETEFAQKLLAALRMMY